MGARFGHLHAWYTGYYIWYCCKPDTGKHNDMETRPFRHRLIQDMSEIARAAMMPANLLTVR
jgi:hypothetical protein